ncbi:hypothetical protein [Alkalispirochaeta sphaeroplastigenens]|nr:hypothetical protein [Alkalispirochaeta sphaeroplastigenens]
MSGKTLMSGTNRTVFVGALVLLLVLISSGIAFAETVQPPQTGEEALITAVERLDEWRTWEIRRELHRIHHHLEFMPIMIFTHVGILLVLVAFLGIKIKEMKKPQS